MGSPGSVGEIFLRSELCYTMEKAPVQETRFGLYPGRSEDGDISSH